MIGLVIPGKAFGITDVEGAVDTAMAVGAAVVPSAAVQLSVFGVDPEGVMGWLCGSAAIRTRMWRK